MERIPDRTPNEEHKADGKPTRRGFMGMATGAMAHGLVSRSGKAYADEVQGEVKYELKHLIEQEHTLSGGMRLVKNDMEKPGAREQMLVFVGSEVATPFEIDGQQQEGQWAMYERPSQIDHMVGTKESAFALTDLAHERAQVALHGGEMKISQVHTHPPRAFASYKNFVLKRREYSSEPLPETPIASPPSYRDLEAFFVLYEYGFRKYGCSTDMIVVSPDGQWTMRFKEDTAFVLSLKSDKRNAGGIEDEFPSLARYQAIFTELIRPHFRTTYRELLAEQNPKRHAYLLGQLRQILDDMGIKLLCTPWSVMRVASND